MKRSLVTVLCLAAVGACTTKHGTVEEVENQGQTATVKLSFHGRVAPGDRVAVLETRCGSKTPLPVSGANDCYNVEVGQGQVVSLIDNKTAIIKPDPGTELKAGMFVQKEKAPAH